MGAFGAAFHFKAHLLAIFQQPETITLNVAVVDKHISLTISFDETIAFFFIKPLYPAVCHTRKSLLSISKHRLSGHTVKTARELFSQGAKPLRLKRRNIGPGSRTSL